MIEENAIKKQIKVEYTLDNIIHLGTCHESTHNFKLQDYNPPPHPLFTEYTVGFGEPGDPGYKTKFSITPEIRANGIKREPQIEENAFMEWKDYKLE